jgi:uncharacterized LabA/DUF88 family protein
MATNTNQKLAVLIDADNAQASVIQELLAEVSRYGTATIKRAYGDWTTTNLKGWKDVLHTMAIQPIQQFSYTSGKNATDSALIIDAMDVLPKLKPMLLNALNAIAREDGWTTLSALGSQINRSNPSFDPRNYGVSKLGDLVRQQAAYLEVKEVRSGDGDAVQTHLHVRRKAPSNKPHAA